MLIHAEVVNNFIRLVDEEGCNSSILQECTKKELVEIIESTKHLKLFRFNEAIYKRLFDMVSVEIDTLEYERTKYRRKALDNVSLGNGIANKFKQF